MKTLLTYAVISCLPGLIGACILWLRRAPGRFALVSFIHYWTVCWLAFYLRIYPIPWWALGSFLALLFLLPITLASGGKDEEILHVALRKRRITGVADLVADPLPAHSR